MTLEFWGVHTAPSATKEQLFVYGWICLRLSSTVVLNVGKVHLQEPMTLEILGMHPYGKGYCLVASLLLDWLKVPLLMAQLSKIMAFAFCRSASMRKSNKLWCVDIYVWKIQYWVWTMLTFWRHPLAKWPQNWMQCDARQTLALGLSACRVHDKQIVVRIPILFIWWCVSFVSVHLARRCTTGKVTKFKFISLSDYFLACWCHRGQALPDSIGN